MLNSWLELTVCRDSSSAGPCLPGEGRTSVLGVNTLNRMRLLDRGAGGGAVHRASAPSAACFTWASPPVPRCERPRKRRSQELPQGRGGGWSRGRAVPALPRLRLSFSSRGVLAPHADEALERQHWAPRGSRLRPHQAARARLSRKRQRNAFSSSAHSVNAKKPSLMCLMK